MLSRGSTTSTTTRPTITFSSANDIIDSTVPTLDTPTINLVLGLNTLDAVQCGVPTRTTPTLTPTTLRSIQQTFEEISRLEPPEAHSNQAGFVPPLVNPVTSSTTFISTVDKNHWGGGVATINRSASPVASAAETKTLHVTSFVPGERGPVFDSSTKPKSILYLDESSTSSSSSSTGEFLSQSSTAIYTPVLTSGGATIITPAVTPSPAILAAQVQNGRRMGGRRPAKHEKLSPEEEERRHVRRERNKQAAARCRKRRLDQTNLLQDETDVLEDKRSELKSEIQILQQQREELEFLLETHKATCRREIHHHHPSTTTTVVSVASVANITPARTNGDVFVKEEPLDVEMRDDDMIPGGKVPKVITTKPSRPTSLAVPSLLLPRHSSSMNDIGVAIETPSSGLRGLNFESMMDGGTGLTPIAPISTGLTPLTTPVVSLPSSNCGIQQRSSSSDLSSPESVSTKLVSL